jgi:glycine betaine/proline transport system substrate-binding protein
MQHNGHVTARRGGFGRLVAGLAVISLILAGCTSAPGASGAPSSIPSTTGSVAPVTSGSPAAVAATCTGAGDKGSVKLMINQWVGAQANVAVIECLLNQMGYKVSTQTLAEEIAWQGFDTGDVDVILENWGHADLEKTYIADKKVAQDAGPNGVTGIIGWYVPEWMVTQYPDILDWNNLNKYADIFKTSESSGKGQFLGSDPTFVTNDEALVTNLNLNYKVVYSGSEAATITAFQSAAKNKTPLLGYFYDPQWLLNTVPLKKVNLPAYTTGCDADPKTVACDYPPYTLNKIVATKFVQEGGDAWTLVKNFTWTNADQNLVADAIANNNMSPTDAAKKWLDAHEATWKAWMPAS